MRPSGVVVNRRLESGEGPAGAAVEVEAEAAVRAAVAGAASAVGAVGAVAAEEEEEEEEAAGGVEEEEAAEGAAAAARLERRFGASASVGWSGRFAGRGRALLPLAADGSDWSSETSSCGSGGCGEGGGGCNASDTSGDGMLLGAAGCVGPSSAAAARHSA